MPVLIVGLLVIATGAAMFLYHQNTRLIRANAQVSRLLRESRAQTQVLDADLRNHRFVLERRDKETALVTLCIGVGMGTATIIERV